MKSHILTKKDVDLILAMKMVDFTLSDYIRDSNMLGKNKYLRSIGNFSLEEFGMRYMMVKYVPKAIGDTNIPVNYIQSGEIYEYIRPF